MNQFSNRCPWFTGVVVALASAPGVLPAGAAAPGCS
jgi:hypothetical protein